MSDRIPQNYKEAVKYIEELPRYTKKHSLQHTRQFLERLGNPGYDRKIIHVAGTNGKGSVCAYMQAVLEAEGKSTGFFTSPLDHSRIFSGDARPILIASNVNGS